MKSKLLSKRLIATFVALVMVVTMVLPVLTACGKKGSTEHTYNEYIQQFPNSWSTHNATTDADSYVQGYTEMGLYAYTLSEDRSTYAFVDEMAKGDPKNVTESYKGQYGIGDSEDTTNSNVGKAWEITLNPDATWENGEKITAEDYVWSMERVLSPEMKNSLSATYITGETAIYNANNYYISGYQESYHKIMEKKVYDENELLALVDKGVLYFSFNTALYDAYGALTLASHHAIASQQKYYKNAENEDVYNILENKYASTANEYGYIQITRDNYNDFKTQLSVISTSALKAYIPNWYVVLSLKEVVSPAYTKILQTATYSETEIDNLINDGKLYFSFQTALYDAAGARTIEEFHNITSQKKHFMDGDEQDIYEFLDETYSKSANEFGYIKITQRNKGDFMTKLGVLSASALNKYIPNWYNVCSIVDYNEENATETTFKDVGIFKTGNDNDKFVIVFKNAVTKYQVKNLLTKNWIVYKPYYEEGYTKQGSLTLTTYGTLSGKYMGYGPYKLKSFQKDKELVLVRNEKWYGYNSDATNYHEGEFETDKIVCQVIANQATALLEFEKGNIDSVRLSANDMDKYKFSDYLLKRTGGNTWSINFNSDADKLAEIEQDKKDGNRRILSVYEFRKALSLCLDRAYIGKNILAGSAAAYSFINSNYYYDLENNPDSIYRNSNEAKQAIVDLYGLEYGEDKTYKTLDEAYRAVSGYDITEAKSLFTQAYEKAVQDGLYTQGQNIRINIYNNAVSSTHTALGNYIQQQVNAATKGTALENKITVEFQLSSNRLADMANGKIEAMYHSYVADYNNPNGMIEKFTKVDEKNNYAYGFDPMNTTFKITFDFDGDGDAETVEKTYNEWQKSIAAGGTYATASNEVRLAILSKLEYNLLNNFQTLPLCVGTDLTLRSKKVNYATDNANIFVAFGGVRLMTYNYNDGEWANFCKKSSNLNYNA